MVTAAIGAGLALGSAIYGGITSAEANNKARKLIQQQRDANKRWYDVVKSQDYTMRTDAQAAIKRLREMYEESQKQAMKRRVVSGATPESEAMWKEAVNKSISDSITGIAENASAHKDSAEAQYRAQDAALNQQQVQNHQQQAAQTAQAASQAVNAGVSLLGTALATGGGNASLESGRNINIPSNVSVNNQGELTSPVNTNAANNQAVFPATPRPINKINS